MAIKIPGLLEVISLDRIAEVLVDAFTYDPKLMKSFPLDYGRRNALEATFYYYGKYDLFYGKVYTLDEDVFEVALLLESKYVNSTKNKCLKAGCYSYEYQSIKERMPVEDRKKRLKIFKEIKKFEKRVPKPKDYLYLDYLGVVRDKQGEGRGTKLMEKICEYADSVNKPIVLYVSSDESKKFYEKFGFEEITSVTSSNYDYTNIYLIRNPKSE